MSVDDKGPLHFMDRLVGGRWHYLAPEGGPDIGMVHSFAWQLPGAMLVSESRAPGGTTYGYWYWHPGEGRGKMLSVGQALEGISLAEYSEFRMDGDTLICELTTHDAEGAKHYREEWQFPDDDHYHWTLFALQDGGEQEVMRARFERRTE